MGEKRLDCSLNSEEDAPFLEVFKAMLDRTLRNLV